MPTYEYICNACEHEFEKFQSMSSAPVKKCPECGKSKVQRKIGTGAGIIFKGGGFYETDYRGDSYKKAAEADKAPSADAKTEPAKSDAPKAEAAKPETKSESKTEAAPAKSESKPAKKPTKK